MRKKSKLVFISALALILCACYSEPEPTQYCRRCDSEYPEKYAVQDLNGDYVCPACAEEKIRLLASGECGICYECNEYFDVFFAFGLGLCHDCGQHVVTECFVCNQPTFEWADNEDFAICGKCMATLMQDERLNQHLRSFVE